MLQIDHDIPIPPENHSHSRKGKYQLGVPWKKMQVGDSVLVPDRTKWVKPSEKYASEWKFTQRRTPEGVRVWRVK